MSLKTFKNASLSTITQGFNCFSITFQFKYRGGAEKHGFFESQDKAIKEDHDIACDSDTNIT